MARPLHVIAVQIMGSWNRMSPYAAPYVSAMLELDSINGMYYQDTAREIVMRFLANAQSWRGAVARDVKAELKRMLDNAN
jgi:hypothetical protein